MNWERPVYEVVQKATGTSPIEQMQCYFKVSNIEKDEEMDMQTKDWLRKVDPLVIGFRERCKQHVGSGKDVAIDELFIRCYGRTRHTLQFPSKAATRWYKLYAFCQQGCLIDFMFSSRTEKIAELATVKDERATTSMIKHFMHQLPKRGKNHLVYPDNIFITVQLLADLKRRGIGAGTAKAAHITLRHRLISSPRQPKKATRVWYVQWKRTKKRL